MCTKEELSHLTIAIQVDQENYWDKYWFNTEDTLLTSRPGGGAARVFGTLFINLVFLETVKTKKNENFHTCSSMIKQKDMQL